jgi:outer membrane lipoprotein-sorting protein
MKKIAITLCLVALVATVSSCAQKTCPTYAKKATVAQHK